MTKVMFGGIVFCQLRWELREICEGRTSPRLEANLLRTQPNLNFRVNENRVEEEMFDASDSFSEFGVNENRVQEMFWLKNCDEVFVGGIDGGFCFKYSSNFNLAESVLPFVWG